MDLLPSQAERCHIHRGVKKATVLHVIYWTIRQLHVNTANCHGSIAVRTWMHANSPHSVALALFHKSSKNILAFKSAKTHETTRDFLGIKIVCLARNRTHLNLYWTQTCKT